jgi:hypothetical protein
VPHFRVVFPAEYRGAAHVASAGRYYVTWPGEPEVELKNIVDIEPRFPVGGPVEVEVTYLATMAIEYGEVPA